jgi:hypothetical protein
MKLPTNVTEEHLLSEERSEPPSSEVLAFVDSAVSVLSDIRPIAAHPTYGVDAARFFGDMEPFVKDYQCGLGVRRQGRVGALGLDLVTPRDLDYRLDTGVITSPDEPPNVPFILWRFQMRKDREIPDKFRAKATAIEVTLAFVYTDRTYWPHKLWFGWNDATSEWTFVGGKGTLKEIGDWRSAGIYFCDLMCKLAFVRRYDWTVSLGHGDGPCVRFDTDPIGAREVFRLRDIPEGASRRAALRHWVAEHWRKRRSDPAEEAKVRAHLRGATEFTWNGLRCKIKPSEYDAERAAKGKGP